MSTTRLTAALPAAAIGAVPGLIMVALAQFAIQGEMQLTIGAPGILLAIAGIIVGFGVGLYRQDRTPTGR